MRVDLPSVETPPATKAAVDTAATTPPSEKATSDSAPQPPTAPSAASVSQNSAGVGASSVTGSIRERSEEHTSELQSLMRISYAVFCLKKKTHHNITNHTTENK